MLGLFIVVTLVEQRLFVLPNTAGKKELYGSNTCSHCLAHLAQKVGDPCCIVYTVYCAVHSVQYIIIKIHISASLANRVGNYI